MHHTYQALYALTWHYIWVKPSPRLLKYQALNPYGHATVEDQSRCLKLIFNSTNIQAIECAYKFALEKRLGTTFRVICKTRIRPRPPDGRWAAGQRRRRAARGWRQDEEPSAAGSACCLVRPRSRSASRDRRGFRATSPACRGPRCGPPVPSSARGRGSCTIRDRGSSHRACGRLDAWQKGSSLCGRFVPPSSTACSKA